MREADLVGVELKICSALPSVLQYSHFYIFFYSWWGETTSLFYQPQMMDGWSWLWSNWWNEDWQGKRRYSEKTCPSTTLSTTNPTWPDPGSNPGRRGAKPLTNRLVCGAAQCRTMLSTFDSFTFWRPLTLPRLSFRVRVRHSRSGVRLQFIFPYCCKSGCYFNIREIK
jgi:hypothetical protein